MGKRVIIVDFNHMAHRYFHSPFKLSVRVVENGEIVEKDTRIHSGTMKSIFNWSNCGSNPTAVCFDRPTPARKMWFQDSFPDMMIGTSNEYKGNRSKMPESMFVAIQDCEKMLRSAGVSVFAKQGYEADDLIFACIQRAKEKYPDLPIDVITNDADMLPLVDDQVSLFLRSKKGTYAEDKNIEKSNYIQVTPRNFQEIVEGLSDYKGFTIPYNSILLHKLLRGDNSDNYKRKDISRMFPPTKWNQMIERMLEDCINFPEIFRYGKPLTKILYKGTDEEFKGTLEEALASPDRTKMYQKICNSEELDAILTILKMYTDMDDDMLSHIEKMYWAINLNQIYPNKNPMYARKAYEVGKECDINSFNPYKLREEARTFEINLSF